jgi:hypothetical protein
MTEGVLGAAAAPRDGSGGALKGAATTWFVVMVIAQWIFVYYIAAFYGERTVSGDFASWNEHPFVKGYLAGDVIGNVAFATHIMLAVLITFGGTLQLIPQLRASAPWLHRWNGRLFLTLSIIVALAGFYMVWLREPVDDVVADLSISVNGVLILLFASLAWREAAARNFIKHRMWALRALLVVNGVFFLRLIFSAWLMVTQTEPSAAFFYVFEWSSYLVPLAVLQLYLHATSRGGPVARYVSAGTLYAASAFMLVGAFGFSMIFIRMIVFGQA